MVVTPDVSPPPNRVPRWTVWPATYVPVGQGRAQVATDLREKKPLAFPQATSGHGVKAAAIPASDDLRMAAEPCAIDWDRPAAGRAVPKCSASPES